MFTKYTRLATVAILSVLCLLTVADAQSAPSPRTAPRGINVGTLHPGNGAGLMTTNSPGTTEATVHPTFFIGWNYIHPQNCAAYYYNGYYFLVVYSVEGGYIYSTDTNWQQVFTPACQAGNWIAFYVYDSALDWNELYTYTYK
jgi:hypothetical protein